MQLYYLSTERMAFFSQHHTLQTRWRRMVHAGLKAAKYYLQQTYLDQMMIAALKQSIATVVCYQQKNVSPVCAVAFHAKLTFTR